MTTQQEWKHQVWRRWLRIIRRRPCANVSADIIVRRCDQPTMADAIDRFDQKVNQPTLTQKLLL